MDRTGGGAAPDLETLLARLTLDEKVTLLSGRGFWVTAPVPRLGIPAVKVTDGPNGARGDGVSGMSAASFPCGSALASTWNPALVAEVGRALGQEAKTKHAQLLLGPTINLHRTPLGGRNFECYSEDPWLSGRLATAFVRGVQSEGVGACLKHFVCNDSEFERQSISSDVDERTLREIYLVPFEMAVRDARPWAVMSAYNRVNGTFASSSRTLLREILKDEWAFDGIVVSDWGAALETEPNLAAGLDLEMPGPTRTRGAALLEAIQAGRVSEADVDDAVRRLLRFVARSGRFGDPEPRPEEAVNRPEHRALARRAAAEGMVLVRNEGLLPLTPERVRRLAVIGPNAARGQIQGGGSSAVFPHYQVMPLDGFRAAGPWEVVHAPGCFNHKYLPMPERGMLTFENDEGGREHGMRLRLFNPDSAVPVVDRGVELAPNPMGGLPLNLLGGRRLAAEFTALLDADFTPAESGVHEFGLISAGLARLFVDDEELIDNWTHQEPGDAFFTWGSTEQRGALHLECGRRYRLRIEFRSVPDILVTGVRYGILPPHPDDLIGDAVDTARTADAAVLVVGSNPDWETEGHDRASLALPSAQDALIQAVLAANPRTAVVLNTGAPVEAPWLERAGAVIQAWLPGQEFGHALADVVTGAVNPAGRLPTTFPRRLEDTPAYTSYPGEHGHVLYGERMFVGYRWYDSRDIAPRLPFGHGLSYTRFAYGPLHLAGSGARVTATLDVTNSGDCRGQEVAQLYVRARAPRVQRPFQELRGFVKCDIVPGERHAVTFGLEPRDFAVWDPVARRWRVEAGAYELRVGASSRDIRTRAEWTITEDILV
jgi:beta-glucosidase